MEPMRFHELCGPNIRLSGDGMVANKVDCRIGGLFLTHRPLAPIERLVLKFSGQDGNSFIMLGLTEKDPRSLEGDLPLRLAPGVDSATGFLGSSQPLDRLREEVLIYLDETKNTVMIKMFNDKPREIIPGFRAEKPLYIIFDTWGVSLQITSKMDFQPETRVKAHSFPKESRTFGGFALQPAQFISLGPSSPVLHDNLAIDNQPSRAHYAFVDTLLKPNCALIAELTELKRNKPVQMALVIKDVGPVLSCIPFVKLYQYSLVMESGDPVAGDELAVRITPSGEVYISHNNRGWIKRMHVDTDFEYHVIFCMKHISVLTLLGLATGLGEVDEKSVVVPDVLLPELLKSSPSGTSCGS